MISDFKDFVVQVLGTYTPVTYGADNVIPPGLAGVDWSYVFAGVLLCIVVWSVFKLIGGCICKMF